MKISSKISVAGLLVFTLIVAAPLKNQAQNRGGDTSLVFKKPANNDVKSKEEALRQKAEQIKGQQKAVREQRRQENFREWQERSVSVPIQPPPIWGQTPLQQQQMALHGQKRQLQRQQQQLERAKQLQFQKQKPKP